MTSRRALVFLGAALMLAGALSAAEPAAPVATTTAGKIRGYLDHGVSAFKGIPYGDDTAKHRFQPPVPPPAWEGVRDMLEFAPMAPQAGGGTGGWKRCFAVSSP